VTFFVIIDAFAEIGLCSIPKASP